MAGFVSAVPRPRREFNLHVLALYVGVHLLCLSVLWTGVTWSGIQICLVTFLVRIIGLGAGYHRYFAHRSFRTSRPVQFLVGLLGTLAMEGGPLWWADTHRRHHRHADSPDDLHSPHHRGFLYAHSGWFLDKAHSHTDFARVADLASFPELRWLNRPNGYLLMPALLILTLVVCLGWSGFLWGFCVSTVLVWHTTHWIQSMSHSYGGYRRFESDDRSRNHWFVALLTLGEWHNNHHRFPWSARQGAAWWEVDVVYGILKALSWAGIVWDLKTPSRALPDDGPAGATVP